MMATMVTFDTRPLILISAVANASLYWAVNRTASASLQVNHHDWLEKLSHYWIYSVNYKRC